MQEKEKVMAQFYELMKGSSALTERFYEELRVYAPEITDMFAETLYASYRLGFHGAMLELLETKENDTLKAIIKVMK